MTVAWDSRETAGETSLADSMDDPSHGTLLRGTPGGLTCVITNPHKPRILQTTNRAATTTAVARSMAIPTKRARDEASVESTVGSQLTRSNGVGRTEETGRTVVLTPAEQFVIPRKAPSKARVQVLAGQVYRGGARRPSLPAGAELGDTNNANSIADSACTDRRRLQQIRRPCFSTSGRKD